MNLEAARLGIARCALAAVLFGASTPLASRLVDDTSAPVLAGLLYLGAAVAAAPLVSRHRPTSRSLRKGGRALAVAVVAGGLVGPLLFVAGLERTPAASASLLLNMELVATVVLAFVFFGEHIGGRVLSGTALVVAGGVALAWSGEADLRVGALLIIGACVCWGWDNCVTAEIDELAPEHVTLAKGVVAGGTNLALGLLLGGSMPSATTVLAALVIGAFGYGFSITLWVKGARDIGAARGQVVSATAPFIGAAVAWILLGDDVRLIQVIALVFGFVGVMIVLESAHEHSHQHGGTEHDHEHSHDDGHHDHEHDDEGLTPVGRHVHPHRHRPVVHAHPHVPDLHHRHAHIDDS